MEDKIKEWLLKGGLPFEMEVSNMFLDAGFTVAQSVYYKDIDEGKYRETDIIAYLCKIINGVFVNLTFVIECKSSTDKPWIILKNDRLSNSVDSDNRIYFSDKFKSSMAMIKNSKKYKSDLIFKNNTKYGYAIVTGLNSGNDRAYEAIQTTLKSCEHFVISTDNSKREKVCNLYFPTIIIKGKLFNASMLENNELELKSINREQVILSRSFHEYNNSIIRIFNEENLKQNIQELKISCEEFFEKYELELKNGINC
ncbi:MAG: hypothetical protein QG594_2276 [Bacteroidota bacterium]|nr:hypothetical protein [Bacteroidota bacterium]